MNTTQNSIKAGQKKPKIKLDPFKMIGGVASIGLGIFHLFVDEYWMYDGMYVNLGTDHVYWGIGGIALGIFLLWLAWHKRHDHKTTHMICPQCESVFPVGEFQDGKCPNDGTPMEPLDGYYDRHPERRGKPLTENRD